MERLEELNNRLNKSSKELADANQREDEMRSELGRKEKDLALVRHEVKEMQRKAEVDLDLRKKAEAERAEIRKRLEDETNKRTREQNNNHHVAEKIANLEKEKRELSEKLKREMENAEKMKKNNNDASVAKVAALSVVSDLNDKIGSLSEDRNALEREVAKMQSQLQLEKNLRLESGEHTKDLEVRLQSLRAEHGSARDREEQRQRENAELNSKLAEADKVRASLELELKSTKSRNEQLVKSQTTATTSSTAFNNRQHEEVQKGLESKLSEEKSARARAEAVGQEKDRELSMLQVDFRQLQYKLDKTEADHRLESEKARGLATQLDRVREEKSLMQSDLSVQASEIALLKANEKRMLRDSSELERENKRLREERTCKICLDATADMLFDPCGHLSTCARCSSSLTECPMCRNMICKKIKVFM